jgi:hypothetical protein
MNYSIDGTYEGSIPLKSNGIMDMFTTASGTVNLPTLHGGSHYLTIHLYGLNQRTYEPKYLSYINTVYFSTLGAIPTSSPTLNPTTTPPTSLSPSPILEPTTEPTTTLEPSQGFLGKGLPVEYCLALVAGLVIIIVSGISLVYFKKLRK